jgi:hypothetical protein
MVFPIGTPNISKYSGNNFFFCSRLLCRSIYIQIILIKILCGLQYLISFFICLKSDTKHCKPHGTPSIWSLENQEFTYHFHCIIFTRSLRDFYEICTRSAFCKARQQGKATGQRQQGARIFSILFFFGLGLSNHYLSIRFSSLFVCI